MSRSPVAIGAIGLAGCLVLGFLMQHLAGLREERFRSPLARLLDEQFARRRVGPVRVEQTNEDGRLRLVVRLCVFAGLNRERIAATAGAAAWNHALATGLDPAQVIVEVSTDEPGPSLFVPVPRPSPVRGKPAMPSPGPRARETPPAPRR